MVVRVKRCGSSCDRDDATIRKKDAGNTHQEWRVEISAAPDRPDRPSPCTLSSNIARRCHQLNWIGRERVLQETKRLPGPSIQSVQASKQPGNHLTSTSIDGRNRPDKNTPPQPKTSADRLNMSREGPDVIQQGTFHGAALQSSSEMGHSMQGDAFLQNSIPAHGPACTETMTMVYSSSLPRN